MDDYTKILYQDEWKTSNPLSTAPGIMTNYTQDLLFSMERLSQNPYPLQLVKPTDALPFQLPGNLTSTITGVSLEELQASGNLFVVDRKWLDHHTSRSRTDETKTAIRPVMKKPP